jgi:hypothetical protein
MFSHTDPTDPDSLTEEDSFLDEDLSEESPQAEGDELSYAEILASAIFNGEIIITIPLEDEERVKNGLKNYKSKQITKAKEEGMPIDSSVLIFTTKISKDFAGCIDMNIQSKTRGTVRVKRLEIPDGFIPD